MYCDLGGRTSVTPSIWQRAPRDRLFGQLVILDPPERGKFTAACYGRVCRVNSEPYYLRGDLSSPYYQLIPKGDNCGSFWQPHQFRLVPDPPPAREVIVVIE